MSAIAQIMRTTALWVCFSGTLGIVLYFASSREGRLIGMTLNNAVLNTTIPPIDRSAPARTETATFALG
jgi:hypothetical protein